jgi:hypothetical protein
MLFILCLSTSDKCTSIKIDNMENIYMISSPVLLKKVSSLGNYPYICYEPANLIDDWYSYFD